MSKFNKKAENIKPKFQFTVYSNYDLTEFDKSLEKYKVDRHGKYYIDTVGETQFLKDNGALNEYGSVIRGECYPFQFDILNDKLYQLNKMKRKQEYAQAMELEDVDKLVNSMQMPTGYAE